MRDRLHGMGRNEIARETGENPITVGRELERFGRTVRQWDLRRAAEMYGVVQEVESLYRVADVARQYNLSPESLAEAAPLAAALKEVNVDPSDTKSLLQELMSMHKKGLSGEELVSACMETASLIAEFGDFQQAKKEYTEIGSKLPQRRHELEEVEAKIRETLAQLDSALAEVGTTKQAIRQFQEVTSSLARFGLNLSDLDSTLEVIRDLGHLGFNARKLVSKVKHVGRLEERVSVLENQIAELELKKEGLQSEINSSKSELASLEPTLEEARRLANTGLSVGQVEKLRNLVLRVSASHGLDPSHAYERFFGDIAERYDALLGLEAGVKEQEARYSELTTRIDEQESALRFRKDEYNKLGKAIDAYTKLKAKGLKDATFILVQKLCDEAELAVPEVVSELTTLAQLETEKGKKQKELDALKREIDEKSMLLKDMTVRRKKLEQETTEFIKNSLSMLKKALSEFVSSIALSMRTATGGADAAVERIGQKTSQFEAALDSMLEHLNSTVQSIEEKISDLGKEAKSLDSWLVMTSKQLGKLELASAVWQFIEGKQVDKASVMIILTTILARLLRWAEQNRLSNVHQKATELKDELEDIIQYGIE
ncbi:MAG: hypothetical protein QXT39_00185 [Conexivisphaerales archaeon]